MESSEVQGPTLDQVFGLIKQKCLLVLEVKVPRHAEIKDMYQWKDAVNKLNNMIQEFNLQKNCVV
jgi:hypothetical protein